MFYHYEDFVYFEHSVNCGYGTVIVIPTVIGTVTKELVQELENLEIRGRAETTQITVLLRSARILGRVPETWGDLHSLRFHLETIGYRWCEKLEKLYIMIYSVISIDKELLEMDIMSCPWCNGYCRRKWTRRHEFKSWTRLVAFHIALIPLGKV